MALIPMTWMNREEDQHSFCHDVFVLSACSPAGVGKTRRVVELSRVQSADLYMVLLDSHRALLS